MQLERPLPLNLYSLSMGWESSFSNHRHSLFSIIVPIVRITHCLLDWTRLLDESAYVLQIVKLYLITGRDMRRNITYLAYFLIHVILSEVIGVNAYIKQHN
jgi:hypothetical protein